MTGGVAAHSPLFAVAEAACLVLEVGALAEREARVPRVLPPFLAAAAIGMLAAGGAALAGRLVATILLAATAAAMPAASRRLAPLAPAAGQGGAGAAMLRVAAALALVVLAAVFASRLHPVGEPVAIALATVLVGLFAAALPAADAVRLARLLFPGGGLALLAANLPSVPAAFLVLPVLLPPVALAAGAAILARVAAPERAPS